MRKTFLTTTTLLLSLACNSNPAAQSAATPAPEEPKEKLSIGDLPKKPDVAALPTTTTTETAAVTSTAPQPAPIEASLLEPTQEALLNKPRPTYEGAVVEDLGPCNGAQVIGTMTVDGKPQPICGEKPNNGYGYNSGYSAYNNRNSSRNNGYNPRYNSPNNSNYQQRRPRSVVIYGNGY